MAPTVKQHPTGITVGFVLFFVSCSHHIAAFNLFIMGANVRPGYGGELWMWSFIWLQMRVCVLKQEALIYNP